jgi:hypothetical protein
MLFPINDRVKLNYGQLSELLTDLGYEKFNLKDGPVVFKHTDSDSIIAVQNEHSDAIVPKHTTAYVLRTIHYLNLMSDEELQSLDKKVKSK